MSRPRRKTVEVIVRISMPKGMTPQQARREVRSLVNEGCNWAADLGDVRVVSISPAPKAEPVRHGSGFRG